MCTDTHTHTHRKSRTKDPVSNDSSKLLFSVKSEAQSLHATEQSYIIRTCTLTFNNSYKNDIKA